MPDSQYSHLPRPTAGVAHRYSDRVHILSHPYAMSLLARLCSPDTVQPEVNHLVGAIFDWLLSEVSSTVLATRQVASPTRMSAYTEAGVYSGEAIDPGQKVVVVDIARGGILPGQRFFDGLNHLLDPAGVRQDHLIASRTTDAQDRVTGVAVAGAKIGGPVDDATVLIPDPMGATGSSVSEVIRRYKHDVGGTPRAIASVHLIVTPEYLRHMARVHPDVFVFAVRLDRGLSPDDVLAALPGELWDRERGLTDNHYIVPGAGGVGEVMNNAWV